MRILLIGGNGFIGAPLVRELKACGHDIAVFHRGAETGTLDGIRQIRGNRNSLAEYRDQIARFAPDVIVDLILSSGELTQSRWPQQMTRRKGRSITSVKNPA